MNHTLVSACSSLFLIHIKNVLTFALILRCIFLKVQRSLHQKFFARVQQYPALSSCKLVLLPCTITKNCTTSNQETWKAIPIHLLGKMSWDTREKHWHKDKMCHLARLIYAVLSNRVLSDGYGSTHCRICMYSIRIIFEMFYKKVLVKILFELLKVITSST
jgi:hypothetical protein